MDNRFTPRAWAAASFLAEKNAASAVAKRGTRPSRLPVNLERRDQQIGVVGTLVIDLVVGDDLAFGLLNLDHLAELGGLGGLALADDFGVRLEHAHDLAGDVGVALEMRSRVCRMTCLTRGIIVSRYCRLRLQDRLFHQRGGRA